MSPQQFIPPSDSGVDLSPKDLRDLVRGEALIHVGQIDQGIRLDPNRLLKLSWLTSELAAHLKCRG